jgi:hypothetical protein
VPAMIFTAHLITPTEVIDLINNHKTSYFKIVKNYYPALFEYANTLKGTSLKEQLYNYCYPGEYRCLTCGSVQVKFQEFTTGYKQYCSPKCSSDSIACKNGQQSFLSDPNRVKAMIKKRKQTIKKRFGVSTWWHTAEGKQQIDEHNKKIKVKFPMEVNGRSRKQYTASARHQTNLTYKQYKHILDPNNLRSREYVLDHIYSVFDGFTNEVPVNVLCHYTNLTLIHKTDNSSKNCRSDKTIEQLYEDYELASSE